METLDSKSKTYLLIMVTLIGIFLGCKKTESSLTTVPPQDTITVSETVTASVAGKVTDLNNIALIGASVSAGTAVTTTDANGLFIMKNIQLDKDAGFVTITKSGFFTGSRTFSINSNSVNNVKIQLIPKTVSGNFNAASGGNINVSGGGRVDYGANSIVNASNNAAYTGTVTVSTFYLNPSAANFNQYMPGDLRGLNTNNQQNVLQSFGMALVEMNDASGGKLQIATGKTATITIPIPSSLQADAPASTPLWYFDETKGLWKQEGTATKQTDSYVGTVGHFSFWTAGQLSQSITLSATFMKDTFNIAYANKLVTLSRADSTTTSEYTDSSGKVNGLVPANEILIMKVYSDCGDVAYSQNIGPFNSDITLASISVVNDFCYSTDSSQYINLSFNGRSYFWSSFHIYENFVAGSSTTIVGGSPQNTSDSSTLFEGVIFGGNPAPGDYPIGIYAIVNGSVTYQAGGLAFDPGYNYPTTTTTKYEDVGGYIEGNISGWIKTFPSIPAADSFPVTGNYRVKRIH